MLDIIVSKLWHIILYFLKLHIYWLLEQFLKRFYIHSIFLEVLYNLQYSLIRKSTVNSNQVSQTRPIFRIKSYILVLRISHSPSNLFRYSLLTIRKWNSWANIWLTFRHFFIRISQGHNFGKISLYIVNIWKKIRLKELSKSIYQSIGEL